MPHVSIDQALAEAIRFQQSGQLREAEAIYRQILAVDQNQPDALHLLGLVTLQAGQIDAALDLINRAVRIDAGAAHYHASLGKALYLKGKLEDAVVALGRALALNPSDHVSQSNLGNAFYDLGRDDDAIAAYRRALALRLDSPLVLSNLSATLMRQGRAEEAIATARQAIELDPNFVDAHINLGAALTRRREFDAAIEAYTAALRLRNDSPLAHLNLGLLLLRNGDYQRGWEEYAWRLKIPGMFKFPNIGDRPRWSGEDLNGRTILLHAEQGFGDTIQFVRYVSLVARRGMRIVLGCPPELQRLFRGIERVAQCVTPTDPPHQFDCHCELSSLPAVFQTHAQTIPAAVPYLVADNELALQWQKRMPPGPAKLQVGLVWSGRSGPRDDRARSVSLQSLAPLAQIADVQFHSLQKGEASRQAKSPPPLMRLIDWNSQVQDFADTAALIQNLDLLVTIDSAVAHLAGAMAKPAFVMLPYVSDWRWMKDGEVSPWYPTLRLFRQTIAGDWTTVITRVSEALRAVISSKPAA